jgi:hypothetical protein
LAPVHTDWLRNRLTVNGPASEVAQFHARPGAPAVSRGSSIWITRRRGCWRRWQGRGRKRARWRANCARSSRRAMPGCAPAGTRPAARHWLWAQWGTTQPLRQVRVLEDNGDRRLRRSARVVYEFLSADWTPWQALLQLRHDWPTLVLVAQPRYGEANGAGDA